MTRDAHQAAELSGNGDVEAVELAGTAVSAAVAVRARWLLGRAKDARSVFVDKGLRKLPAGGVSSEWLKQIAAETLEKRGPNGLSGSLGQFRGHLFEVLDVRAYNLHNAAKGRRLILRAAAHAPGYDASRFVAGRFAGGVQHKLSPSGVIKAANKLDARKAGSAAKATLRLPKDQKAAAVRKLAGRMRVEASSVTTGVVKRQGNAGLRQLSSRGSSAVSAVNQFGRSTGIAALTGVAFGAVGDAAKMYRRQMDAQEFIARRGIDAAEQVATHAASTATTAGVMVGATAAAAKATGTLAVVAAAVAGSSVVAPAAISLVAGAAVARAIRPMRRKMQELAKQRALGEIAEPESHTMQDAEPENQPAVSLS